MTSPSWPVELATFNPETEYLNPRLSGVQRQAGLAFGAGTCR